MPPGGRIDWATYYFRDRALAKALLTAQARGVHVRLVMESKPRRRGANDEVIRLLREGGLRSFYPRRWRPGRLHSKIYAFSHPDRCWVGSFNPSGDEPEDPAVIAEIGDQDRGDNLLAELTSPVLVGAARRAVSALSRASPLLARFDPRYPKQAGEGGTALFFFPRLRPVPLLGSISGLGKGDRVSAAMSHLKPGPLLGSLETAVKRGAKVALVVHATERRVPAEVLDRQRLKGFEIARAGDGSASPMHAKMLLLRAGDRRESWIGSYNSNFRSRHLNAEVLVRSEDAALFAAAEDRFHEIKARSDA